MRAERSRGRAGVDTDCTDSHGWSGGEAGIPPCQDWLLQERTESTETPARPTRPFCPLLPVSRTPCPTGGEGSWDRCWAACGRRQHPAWLPNRGSAIQLGQDPRRAVHGVQPNHSGVDMRPLEWRVAIEVAPPFPLCSMSPSSPLIPCIEAQTRYELVDPAASVPRSRLRPHIPVEEDRPGGARLA